MAARLSTERVLGRLVRFTAPLLFFSLFLFHFSLEKKNARWPASCFEDGHSHFTSLLVNGRGEDRRSMPEIGSLREKKDRGRLLTR